MTGPEPPLLQELRQATARELHYDDMLSGPLVGSLLRMLTSATSARNVLEVGTFTGYATLQIAMGMPEGGRIWTCEYNDRYARIARRFFRHYHEQGGGAEIHLLAGPALETIPNTFPDPATENVMDIIFLDADKERYPAYYELVIPLLRPGGLLLVDNAFWGGSVWREEGARDRKAAAINRLNHRIREDSSVENVLLPLRDGLHLVRKKAGSS